MQSAEPSEVILASGHKNILATHQTTMEITKETYLSKKGDCIVAVGADRALAQLGREFKQALRKDEAKLAITVEADGVTEIITAYGSSKLILTSPLDLVIRRSSYICGRTLAVRADKSASQLSRRLVKKLKDPNQEVKIELVLKV